MAREFEVDTDVLHAGGNRLRLIRDDVTGVAIGPSRSSAYGHDGLDAAASMFADRWGYAVELVSADLDTAGSELQAAARSYRDRDEQVGARMEPL